MRICVPSSNRAGKTTTQDFIKGCVFFVPENQATQYRAALPNEIVPVPEKYNGITKTRNFILNHYKGRDVLFIDDDTKEAGLFKEGQRVSFQGGDYTEKLTAEFKRIFDLCRGLGFKIWGVEAGGSKYANHFINPFSFYGIINCSFMGIISDGEFVFDETFEVKEDYEIILRHFKRKGGFLKARHFYWRTEHWGNLGGCVDYRTDQLEEKNIKKLEDRYYGMIIRGKAKNKHQIRIKWV